MDKKVVTQYLENVVDLEKQCYLQQRTIKGLSSKINSLGIGKQYVHPDKPALVPTRLGEHMEKILAGGLIGLLIGVPVGFLDCTCATIRYSSTAFGSPAKGWLGWTIVGTAAGLFIGLLLGLIGYSDEKREQADLYANRLEQYKAQLAQYEHAVAVDKARVEAELRQKQKLIAERKMLEEEHARTKKLLQQYYATDILYGKYQNNFVAVASFLDYFKSGRCSTLGENHGADGAYNTFEQELLMHRVIAKLENIINSLEEVKSNQWTIYNAVQLGNQKSDALLRGTEQLALAAAQTAQNSAQTARNSAIAAYNSERAASEANQIKWLQIYNSMK